MLYNKDTPSTEVPIWAYWEGPKPPWIALCHEIMLIHIPTLRILTKEEFETEHFIDNGHNQTNWKIQRPNVQSDFIRAHQLRHYGGIWLDSDCIVFKDISPIWDMLKKHSFVAYRVLEPRQELCSALLASYSNSKVARQYLHIMNKKLKAQPDKPLRSIALGPNVLHRARKVTKTQLGFIPTKKVHPVHWLKMKTLWKRQSDEEHEKEHNYPGAYCFMLTHRSIGPHKKQTREQILNGKTVISYFFRRALK